MSFGTWLITEMTSLLLYSPEELDYGGESTICVNGSAIRTGKSCERDWQASEVRQGFGQI